VTDEAFMRRALALATAQAGKTGTNPAVGCVIVTPDGAVIGEGATGDGGRPHAEEVALLKAGEDARGCTAYVTLEPCAQRSSGGVSCSELLGGARVARVVIANFDPHPFAAGNGIARLRGVGVEVTLGVLEQEAAAHNADFFSSIARP
jgi:diaminohydroxyphosphoribosylaminopyrimidine deaminase/5-amino-6-(5-phosphoribosylamino)uracil reductase